MAKIVKKAQDGDNLRKGQYKRIGRISEKNPERAGRVAERMNTRASRVERGKEIANPSTMIANPSFQSRMNQMPEYEFDRKLRMEKSKDDNKMKMGGKLKPVDKTKKPGLAKLPKAVRNKMGFKKNGGAMSKKK
jgi:hypothetical protein